MTHPFVIPSRNTSSHLVRGEDGYFSQVLEVSRWRNIESERAVGRDDVRRTSNTHPCTRNETTRQETQRSIESSHVEILQTMSADKRITKRTREHTFA